MIVITLLQVYLNTVRNWVSLDSGKCCVKPIMFITNQSGLDVYILTEFAQRLGWNIIQAPKLSTHGVPFVKDMYRYAAKRLPNCSYYAYSNGDILYSHGLIDTLEAVSEVHAGLHNYKLSKARQRRLN